MNSGNFTRTLLFLVIVIGISLCTEVTIAGEGKNDVEKNRAAIAKVELPPRDSAEYWIIRSQTMTEFIPFMTQKRTEFMKSSKLMEGFLVKIDKAKDFYDSGVKAPDDHKLYMEVVGLTSRIAQANENLTEKRPNWEECVELAMKMVMLEGYLPTNVADKQELKIIMQLSAQKEKYGMKIRNELHDLVQKCLNAWFYLGTINMQGAFREYKLIEEEKERIEKEKAFEQRKKQLQARSVRGDRMEDMRRYDARYRRNRINYNNYGYYRYRW